MADGAENNAVIEEAEKSMVPVPERLQKPFGLKESVTADEYESKVSNAPEQLILQIPAFKSSTEDLAIHYRKALVEAAEHPNDKTNEDVQRAKAMLEDEIKFQLEKMQKDEELQRGLAEDKRFKDLKLNAVDADKLIALIENGMEELANAELVKKLEDEKKRKAEDQKAKGDKDGEAVAIGEAEDVEGVRLDDRHKLPPPPKKPASKGQRTGH